MTITTAEREEAERTKMLLDRSLTRISEYKFPELIVIEPEDLDDYDDSSWDKFQCPWCNHVEYIEEGYSMVVAQVQTCNITEPNDPEDTSFEYDNDPRDTQDVELFLQCGSCQKPVSLPDSYSIEPY